MIPMRSHSLQSLVHCRTGPRGDLHTRQAYIGDNSRIGLTKLTRAYQIVSPDHEYDVNHTCTHKADYFSGERAASYYKATLYTRLRISKVESPKIPMVIGRLIPS